MNTTRKKSLVSMLRHAERCTPRVGLFAVVALFLYYLPIEILLRTPATGGDMGSHFWPLYTLVSHGLPNFLIRVWNPGNLAGEPQLVHYFPLPFLIMCALSLVLPLGMAFNVGGILPIATLPLAVYWGVKKLGFKHPKPLLAMTFSLFALYNESFSMWGGNTLSTLAGQFAHLYALNFLFLGIGALAVEIREQRSPFWSSLWFAAVTTSHAYVMLGIPPFLLAFVFFYPHSTVRLRLKLAFLSGVLALLLSAWHTVPMIDNQQWTTALPMTWVFGDSMEEYLPVILLPCIIGVLLALPIPRKLLKKVPLKALLRFQRQNSAHGFLFWFVPICVYLAYYFVFPKLGLVNIRALPQVYLILCVMSGIAVGGLLLSIGKISTCLGSIAIIVSSLWWTHIHVVSFPGWLQWNLSGWKSKELYPALTELSKELRGDFSLPRVVYEHNEISEAAGTTRVFEMLPYFANRSTLESVYAEANIVAPMIWYIQALVSKTPSCIFSHVKCPDYDIQKAIPKVKLFGVGELILVTDEVLAQARLNEELTEVGKHGPWHLFRLIVQPELVEVFRQIPELSREANWKKQFLEWFIEHEGNSPMLIHSGTSNPGMASFLKIKMLDTTIWEESDNCAPKVEVYFNHLKLQTNCAGKAHYLKFAYHPSWKADSGDQIFMASPGFLALIPSSDEVLLTFGESTLWFWADFVSIASALLLLAYSAVLISKR
ncbi:MAG: hypothetical protein IT291_04630 [Deltaproteobacteria bacterium]|nr:hypothetical protein [Deltaproteobacteria bacterium]